MELQLPLGMMQKIKSTLVCAIKTGTRIGVVTECGSCFDLATDLQLTNDIV
jgi:hypothetical protein